jgi:hypothetical protein
MAPRRTTAQRQGRYRSEAARRVDLPPPQRPIPQRPSLHRLRNRTLPPPQRAPSPPSRNTTTQRQTRVMMSRGTATVMRCRMGRWLPAITMRAPASGSIFPAYSSRRHQLAGLSGFAAMSARSSTQKPRRRGNVRAVVGNRKAEGVQGVLEPVDRVVCRGQARRERARLSLRIFGLDGMLFEAPN